MATPDFILNLREKVGNQQLFLPTATAIILRPVPAGAPLWEVPSVLLARRADNGKWAPIAGIMEPGEEAAAAAVREVKEEVGLDAKAEALIGVGTVGPVTYSNGDECIFADTCIRLSVPDGAEPTVSDEENTDAGWFPISQLPQSVDRRTRLCIADAAAQMKHPQGFRPRMGYVKRV
ncbi:NUDIX hydrolase [Corynebacterium endometrii]|uniref:Dihydroneopterin triphosphate pyrophosphatase n=1 Tax=Corynebacterium endometrii TaxID=2488819 RepID=A0A4V1CEQ0_9CORY|nr:NUDIX domain-containing protein [Corynebacterium endometrii]QCB28878.1 dihydroneopterin triphosphate pyrophosphatase [Corynebacterium endometrii]